MARNIELWNHLPPFLKDFREMCALIDTENPEFNLAAQVTDATVDEMFIQTATDTGLKRFEKILGISPMTGDSLESRRSAIMTRWHDITPYTMNALKNRIIAIQGNDEVEIILSKNRPYEIEIITRLENPGQVNDLAYIIKTMIPCNLVIHSLNVISGETSLGIGYGIGASMAGTILLTNDLNERKTFSVPLGMAGTHGIINTLFLTNDLHTEQNLFVETGVGAGMSAANVLFLTNDLKESIDIGGTASVGMGGSIANIIEIT